MLVKRILYSAALLVTLLLVSCGGDKDGLDFPFERSVLEMVVQRRCLANSGSTEQCYALRWRHPIERRNLVRYHVWLDTTVINDSTLSVPNGALAQSIKKEFAGSDRGDFDSLDLTPLVATYLTRDSLQIAMWAEFSDGGDAGAMQRVTMYFGDDMPPARVALDDSAGAKTLSLAWLRPTDQVDFYFPESLSGPIAGYNMVLSASNENEDLSKLVVELVTPQGPDSDSSHWLRHHRFRLRQEGLQEEPTSADSGNVLRLLIRDGQGFNATPDSNLFTLHISGLTPRSLYTISITPYDVAGNSREVLQSSDAQISFYTTDTLPPLMGTRLWVARDSLGLARLDSNRLVLWWPKSVDPLRPNSGIIVDSSLRIPKACLLGTCWSDVATYAVELWDGAQWVSAPVAGSSPTQTWDLVDSTMVPAIGGLWVHDTLRWVVPGDTIILRIFSKDSSGAVSQSLVDTLISSWGELANADCPAGFVPVLVDSNWFCMQRFEHQNTQGSFVRNVVWQDAREQCLALSTETHSVDLCSEQQWQSGCAAGERSPYGVIQETGFVPQEFLFQNCNLSTGDSASAIAIESRNSLCANPWGVRDLPGNLQEWVLGVVDADTVPILKGSSYLPFDDPDRTRLGKCSARAIPHRIRARYTTDTAWLYRNGSLIDTLFEPDTTRQLFAALAPDQFKDTLLFFTLRMPGSEQELGIDYLDQREYRKRGGEKWTNVLYSNLDYQLSRSERVLIRGTLKYQEAAYFYLDPSIGFRCCAFTK